MMIPAAGLKKAALCYGDGVEDEDEVWQWKEREENDEMKFLGMGHCVLQTFLPPPFLLSRSLSTTHCMGSGVFVLCVINLCVCVCLVCVC